MAKKRRKKDPHWKREAEKYKHPVPSREFITQYLEDLNRPVTLRHLLKTFDIKSSEEGEGLRRRLIAMQRDGQLISNRRGSFALVKKLELIRGRVQGHREGFGFVIPDDASGDIFLSAYQMQNVFPDDLVLARVTGVDRRGRREGAVVEILQRNTQQVVGRFYQEGASAFVDPDDKNIFQDILIPETQRAEAKHGQFVVVDITEQPSRRRLPQGKIIEILGDHLTPGMEVELAIRSHQLPYQWSEEVEKEAAKYPQELSPGDFREREDLRKLAFVTIDGEDARDFDDAVYCEKRKGGGWRLLVAIADVSHYVKPKSVMDTEAQLRGNSVYFPNKVIPMLPEVLSNHLCSLMPSVDRLAMVCDMLVDKKGSVTRFKFYEAVIHSCARLTYTQTYAILKGEKNANAQLSERLFNLYDLYNALAQQRQQRGAIEFDSIETKIIFDKNKKIKRIVPRQRNEAHRLIEEMMLLANMCAGKYLERADIVTLYRIHDEPEEQKLLSLADFLKALGLRLTGGKKPSAMDYSKLLKRIEKRPDAHLIQTVLLRSMRQASYSPENRGHFGLNYPCYTHFTSPIRRYPDLLVHRGVKHLIRQSKRRFIYDEETMQQMGEHCSITERRADLATRDAVDWLKCEYMMDKIGQTFDGIISEVTGFGVFVELQDIYVQGLVHVTSLANDYYHYDAIHRFLRGKRSGKIYRLGDSLRVIVARVDMDERRIDFELGK